MNLDIQIWPFQVIHMPAQILEHLPDSLPDIAYMALPQAAWYISLAGAAAFPTTGASPADTGIQSGSK